jgi:phosphoglycerate dehydrogenase-like enzyme
VHVLVSFALEPDLVEQIRAVDPQRIEVSVLGSDQRKLLRGFTYPSERERAAVAEGLNDAFSAADVVFGFWGAELHQAFTGAGSLADVAPNLRWIQLTSAGADRLLNSGFIQQGVTVTTVSGLHATPIGEFVISSILMIAKKAPQYMRAQSRHEWSRFMTRELCGATVGIIGLGNIGAEVGRLAKSFGCRVIATRRSTTERHPALYADEIRPASELHSVLAESDYVVLSMPLTPETRGMIGEPELRIMKPTAGLINIARGPVVDEAALIRALNDGTIAAAALDVFDQEPLPAESPLWDMENVIVSPHISGGTEIYNQRAVAIFCDNLRAFLDGDPLRNVVDPDRGY